MHPAQQHGLRFPFASSSDVLLILCSRVSSFLADVTQQIHSLRASGVMSCHASFIAREEESAFSRSFGRVCMVPVESFFITIVCNEVVVFLFYTIPLSTYPTIYAIYAATPPMSRVSSAALVIFPPVTFPRIAPETINAIAVAMME